MDDIEKEIDYLIQTWGYRLGQEDHGTRDRARHIIERQKIEREEWLNRPIPTVTFKGRF